jgi:hypothetical protein
LQSRDIVSPDNVKFYRSEPAVSLIEADEAKVLHIPAYSPDLDPIE